MSDNFFEILHSVKDLTFNSFPLIRFDEKHTNIANIGNISATHRSHTTTEGYGRLVVRLAGIALQSPNPVYFFQNGSVTLRY